MFFLSPAKVLVILVVAVIVLGPDKLPHMARQVGGLWADFRRFRQRLETGVRDSFPDLPSTDVITRAVRSPVAFLDELAETHGTETTAVVGEEEASVAGPVVRPGAGENRPQGEVHTTAPEPPAPAADDPAATVPGVPAGDPDGVVHRIRASGYTVPDDPGLN